MLNVFNNDRRLADKQNKAFENLFDKFSFACFDSMRSMKKNVTLTVIWRFFLSVRHHSSSIELAPPFPRLQDILKSLYVMRRFDGM